jgi:hypothetical protein
MGHRYVFYNIEKIMFVAHFAYDSENKQNYFPKQR